jgi:hypothetical protein
MARSFWTTYRHQSLSAVFPSRPIGAGFGSSPQELFGFQGGDCSFGCGDNGLPNFFASHIAHRKNARDACLLRLWVNFDAPFGSEV